MNIVIIGLRDELMKKKYNITLFYCADDEVIWQNPQLGVNEYDIDEDDAELLNDFEKAKLPDGCNCLEYAMLEIHQNISNLILSEARVISNKEDVRQWYIKELEGEKKC